MSEHNIPTMTIKKYLPFAIANANLQINGTDVAIPYIVGSPGIGKSQFIEKYCKEHGFGFFTTHLSLLPIEDLSGLPVFKKIPIVGFLKNIFDKMANTLSNKSSQTELSGTEWSLPDVMTKIYEISSQHEKVIVLFDDMHMCSPAHLALGYEMFAGRKLRGFPFPSNVAFLLAGNDTAKSGAKQMFGAIINRYAVNKVVPDLDQWINDFAIPNNINPKIVSFLQNKINHAYFCGEESTNSPWSSPRSWTRFSNFLNPIEQYLNEIPLEDVAYHSYGHLGGNASSEFTAYYNIYSKTEMDKIFEGKKEIKIPNSNSDIYIYGMAASNEYINRTYSDKSKAKDKDIISEIIIGIGKSNIEVSIALLKNIHVYGTIIHNQEGGSGKKISKVINDIFETIKQKDPVMRETIAESLNRIMQIK